MKSNILSYGEIGIDKSAFHNNATSISIDEVENNRIVLFDKTSYGNKGLFKYYIGYKHEDGTFSPLNINFPRLTGYTKHFNDNKYISLLVTDKELLKKYNEICNKIKNLFKITITINNNKI